MDLFQFLKGKESRYIWIHASIYQYFREVQEKTSFFNQTKKKKNKQLPNRK